MGARTVRATCAPRVDRVQWRGMNEPALIAAAKSGDRAALEALLAAYAQRVYGFGMRMCSNHADAEDVAQETMIALARGIDTFAERASLSTWLYTVARSFCIKKRRKSKYAPAAVASLESDPGVAAAADAGGHGVTAPTPDAALAQKQAEAAIVAALGRLPPSYREVLLLRDVEGLTAPEAATVLGLTVAAVKTRLHRARAELRGLLGDALGAASPATPSCPDVMDLFSQHVEGEISAAACAAMEQHLAGCTRCQGVCDSLRSQLALCRTAGGAVPVPAKLQSAIKVALQQVLQQEITKTPQR